MAIPKITKPKQYAIQQEINKINAKIVKYEEDKQQPYTDLNEIKKLIKSKVLITTIRT